MLSASNIKGKNFSTVKNGFDPEEVDSFLVQTASDYAALEKQNLDQADEIERLKAELEQYKADEEAIRSSLVLAHKESAKIIADAKAQSKQMLDSAKSEQVRLSEQSAAECERIVKEHKAKCAELIQQNTDITERKLDEIRAAYDEELEAYENLQAEVTYFKANLTELYNKQIRLVMELPTMTPEELDEIRAAQENESIKGIWGKWAKHRDLSFEEIEKNIADGKAWTLRLKSPGSVDGKCFFDDMIKGKIEMPENVQDVVILKSDGIPTYHFAHAVDDHLMRTTHVVRGDEWISSTPIHLQLFRVLGFKPPKYAHVAPIMKEENGGKRKLSKRKDPEAAVTYYAEEGYPSESVNEYMLTLANSNFEDWRRMNKDESLDKFPFNLKKMSVSGALFDMVKLTDVSKNVISKMPAQKVYSLSYEWAKEYNPALAALYEKDAERATAILNIDRENKKPRKDIAKWSDIPDYISYMYGETFVPCYELTGNATPALAVKVLEKYVDLVNLGDSKDEWFERIKGMCESVGCTPNV